MSKFIDLKKVETGADLEAIYDNWKDRVRKLNEYHENEKHDIKKRLRAAKLSFKLGVRLVKLLNVYRKYQSGNPKRMFKTGGIIFHQNNSSDATVIPKGEYILNKRITVK